MLKKYASFSEIEAGLLQGNIPKCMLHWRK